MFFAGLNCVFIDLSGQEVDNSQKFFKELGLELQFYPAGFITSVRAMHQLRQKSALMMRIGYNNAQRQDFGEHNDEQGGGPGMSLGYRYYLSDNDLSRFFVAARLGIWFMNINWKDERMGVEETGSTFIGVLQPTFAGGYQHVTKNKWSFGLSAAFGIEWNVISNGENVGQGGISILFISLSKRF